MKRTAIILIDTMFYVNNSESTNMKKKPTKQKALTMKDITVKAFLLYIHYPR